MPDLRPADTLISYEKNAIRKMQRRMTQRILEELELNENSCVLDVGCGSGFSMEIVKCRVFGFDISSELLLGAKRKGIKNIVRANFKEIPFRDCVFDAVISVSALQQFEAKDRYDVEEHYFQIAKEFCRVLKRNGRAGIQFYPASEVEWKIAVKQFKKFFSGYIIEEGEGRKRKRYVILRK